MSVDQQERIFGRFEQIVARPPEPLIKILAVDDDRALVSLGWVGRPEGWYRGADARLGE
jgi:hypothetical protein